jgi:cytochrome P450
VNIHNRIHKFIGKLVENHKKTFNINDEPRDLIGVYLKILLSVENNNRPDENSENSFPPNFTDKEIHQQLLAVCLDFFMAGSETTTKTLSRILLIV